MSLTWPNCFCKAKSFLITAKFFTKKVLYLVMHWAHPCLHNPRTDSAQAITFAFREKKLFQAWKLVQNQFWWLCPSLPAPTYFIMGNAQVRPCPNIFPIKHHYTRLLLLRNEFSWHHIRLNLFRKAVSDFSGSFDESFNNFLHSGLFLECQK